MKKNDIKELLEFIVYRIGGAIERSSSITAEQLEDMSRAIDRVSVAIMPKAVGAKQSGVHVESLVEAQCAIAASNEMIAESNDRIAEANQSIAEALHRIARAMERELGDD